MGPRAASPEDASVFIEPGGFVPVEVNIRAGSIDRLVEILGGETLYGPNPLVPVRELLQKAAGCFGPKAGSRHHGHRHCLCRSSYPSSTSNSRPSLFRDYRSRYRYVATNHAGIFGYYRVRFLELRAISFRFSPSYGSRVSTGGEFWDRVCIHFHDRKQRRGEFKQARRGATPAVPSWT